MFNQNHENITLSTEDKRLIKSWIKSEVDLYNVDGNSAEQKMEYKGLYVHNSVYNKNEVVLDGTWTMIANKETQDRPAPQPLGIGEYKYLDTLSNNSVTASYIIFGLRYVSDTPGLLVGYRVYTINTQYYSVQFINLDTGQLTEYLPFVATSTGWVEFSIPSKLLHTGCSFDIIATTSVPAIPPVTFVANYRYRTPTSFQTPLAGNIIHPSSDNHYIYVSTIDDDATDRAADLASLSIGSKISNNGVTWTIQSIESNGVYYTFGISPITQLPTGTQEFTFEVVTASIISYSEDLAYWAAIDNINGLYVVDDTYGNIVINDNAYGIDIKIQNALVSEDWELVAQSN